MIVRCNNCVSAFAVDDEKVANKKFAFTCPKCNSENIIDNRIAESELEKNDIQLEESLFNDDFSIDTNSSGKDKEEKSTPDEALFDEAPAYKEESFSSLEDELASEFPAGDLISETADNGRNLNLEIEETADFSDIDDDLFAEKSSADKKEMEDDLFSDAPAFDAEDDFISFDEKETIKTSPDEFGIELKEDSAVSDEEEIFFDDFDETPVKQDKKDDLLDIAEDFEIDEMEIETPSEESVNEREKKVSTQDDIDALFAEEGIEFDEKPISKQSELDFEDEITVDLDLLDIELEENLEEKSDSEETVEADSPSTAVTDSEDITLDIDSLDIDLDDSFSEAGIFEEPAPAAKEKEKPIHTEEDITLDIDNLDIDLDDSFPEPGDLEEPAAAVKQKEKPVHEDEDITLDIDSLDIDLDDSFTEAGIFDESAPAAKQKEKPVHADEDITLDIDNLDIDLDDSFTEAGIFEEPAAVKKIKSAGKDTSAIDEEIDFNEEDIKLNLDDLDIDLDEIEDRDLIFEDDIIEKPSSVSREKIRSLQEEDDEDESITIDLDTLEIEIADENNLLTGELSEEDEKLTLDDAGLTFDELTSEIKKSQFEEPADEELKLTLDEIDPEMTLDKIAKAGRTDTERMTDTLDELPEIDLDEYDAIIRSEETRATDNYKYESEDEDEFIVFPDLNGDKPEERKPDYDIFDYEEPDHEKAAPGKGNTFFSIDFSLKYSRTGALLRLLGLYILSMIPHFIVMLIYTILSSILGFINQIVILSTGRCVEDFALVIENTMRYFFYIKTNILGIVEDRPVYAGRESIDHPLQMNITYPLKYSKNLAILRLSIIGILVITLPHLIIMSVITLTIPVIYLAGIVTVIVTRRWPNVLFTYLMGYFRYLARISSFMTGLTDEYPPFNFD